MIIHVTSVYPPKLGGLEKVVQTLAAIETQMGMKVAVITSNQGIEGGDIPVDNFLVDRLRSFKS